MCPMSIISNLSIKNKTKSHLCKILNHTVYSLQYHVYTAELNKPICPYLFWFELELGANNSQYPAMLVTGFFSIKNEKNLMCIIIIISLFSLSQNLQEMFFLINFP